MSATPSSPATPTTQTTPAAREAAQLRHPENFRDRFCKAHRCPPHKFADRVFLLALHFHALLIALLLWPWRRRLFAPDFALIEKVAGAQWRGDVQWKIDHLRTPEWHGGPGRRRLRCGISTQRLGTLMGKVMQSSERDTADLANILQTHQPVSR